MRLLEPAIKTVWTIKFAIVSACLFTVVLGYELYGYIGGSSGLPLPTGALSAAAFVAGLLVTLAIPRLRYRYWRFDLRPEELYLERGIFNRIRTVVPLRRIQHLDVSQNILEREFELSKLIVHTAGSRSSDVVLPGLRMEEAERLRDDVKRYILDDAV
ncbi:MAG: PH domain-containing protein [Rhodothermales bacterium]|nr:PH domain-containing protein [Rhodothermales bacterium]